MLAQMNFSFLVKRTLFKISLDVVRSDVGVVTPPGKLIIFTPTLSRLQYDSTFCGCI